MSYETILANKEDGICFVTLNRPKSLNAINIQMVYDLEALIKEIEDDREIRCVVITGAGKGFCAGADINELVKHNFQIPEFQRRYSFFNRLEDLGKPTIAAINGQCNGGGLELVLCCDFRIASEEAKMGLGEVKLGAIPLAGGTARLPRLIGPGLAKEFLYFGNRSTAEEASRIGLVNKVVPPGELMDEAKKWAAELAERAPLSLKMLKTCVNQGLEMDLMGALDYEARCGAALLKSEDLKEGMTAFIEKRKPDFKGE